jgi:hypothetical protein
MFGLFRPLEEYAGPCVLSAVVLLGCMLKFSLEYTYLQFIECDVFTVTWILEYCYLD